MNSNTLPIVLMQSLVITVPEIKWGAGDSGDEMLCRALTYLVLHSGLGMMVISAVQLAVFPVLRAMLLSQVRWSYGVRLLSKADPKVGGETSPEPVQSPVAEPVETVYPDTIERPPEAAIANDREAGRASPLSHRCNVDEPNASLRDEESDDDAAKFPLARRLHTEPTSSIWQSRRRRLGNRLRELWKVFYECMTMPLRAALASLVVACISPLQRTLAHIECIRGALDMAGDCSIPLTLVVLGAYF